MMMRSDEIPAAISASMSRCTVVRERRMPASSSSVEKSSMAFYGWLANSQASEQRLSSISHKRTVLWALTMSYQPGMRIPPF